MDWGDQPKPLRQADQDVRLVAEALRVLGPSSAEAVSRWICKRMSWDIRQWHDERRITVRLGVAARRLGCDTGRDTHYLAVWRLPEQRAAADRACEDKAARAASRSGSKTDASATHPSTSDTLQRHRAASVDTGVHALQRQLPPAPADQIGALIYHYCKNGPAVASKVTKLICERTGKCKKTVQRRASQLCERTKRGYPARVMWEVSPQAEPGAAPMDERPAESDATRATSPDVAHDTEGT